MPDNGKRSNAKSTSFINTNLKPTINPECSTNITDSLSRCHSSLAAESSPERGVVVQAFQHGLLGLAVALGLQLAHQLVGLGQGRALG